jgi:hypothetical protein
MRVTCLVVACLAVLEGCEPNATGPAPATPAAAPVASAAPMASTAPAAAAPMPTPTASASVVAPPPPPPGDGLAGDAAAVAIARDVAAALTNVTTPENIPPSWANRVGSPSGPFKAHWASLIPSGSHPEVVATLLDVGAVTTEPGVKVELGAKLVVLGDGRVRWTTISAREGAKVDSNPTPGLAAAEPAVSALLLELVNRLNTGPCQLSFLSGEELLSLPTPVRGELGADIPTFAESCAIVRKHRQATWGPILEAAVALVRQGDAYFAVAAHFLADNQAGRLVLEPIDVVPVKGRSMELAWSEAAGSSKGPATPAPGKK